MGNNELITYLLNNNGKPTNETWLEIAKKFNIGENLTDIQKSKKVNDIWRGYLRNNEKQLSDFEKDSRIKKVSKWQAQDGKWLQSIVYEKSNERNNLESFKRDLIKEISQYEFPKLEMSYSNFNRLMACINIFDAHIEKMTLVSETGFGSKLEDNIQIFEKAFDELLTTAKAFSPEVIVFPIIGDFFNTNDSRMTTKRGTPQDNSTKHHDAFKVGVNLLRRCIDKATQVGPVIVPIVRGNHDEDAIYYLATLLDTIYLDNPNVTIDATRLSRKYIQFGENLLGFAHGDSEKPDTLPLIMAEEQKEAWSKTKYRQWFLGDKHHHQDYMFRKGKDFIGARVTYLRSITPTDFWHHKSGYIGVPKSAELYLFHFEEGQRANFTINVG